MPERVADASTLIDSTYLRYLTLFFFAPFVRMFRCFAVFPLASKSASIACAMRRVATPSMSSMSIA